MILEMIYTMLGPWSRPFIAWTIANPLPIGTFFTALLAFFAAGKWQLKRIDDRTKSMVIEGGRKALGENPQITAKELFEKLHPEWEMMLRETALFIPHRFELWPVPAAPQTVSERINFNSEWLGQYLWENGIKIRGGKPKKKSKQESQS
jgi:hypothetical protein